MGQSYSAKIIVGLHRSEMGDVEEDVLEGMDHCPPYYDGGDEAIIGYEVQGSGNYSAVELRFDLTQINNLLDQFRRETGLNGKVWLSTCGY